MGMKLIFKRTFFVVLCLYSLFFVFGSILSPIMAHFHNYDLSGKLTSLYMFSCHQRPERSFWILGYPVALCCRCLGVYIGVVISSIAAILEKFHIKLTYILVFLFVTTLDITLNYFLKITTSNIQKFLIGMIIGYLLVTFIYFIFHLKKED